MVRVTLTLESKFGGFDKRNTKGEIKSGGRGEGKRGVDQALLKSQDW